MFLLMDKLLPRYYSAILYQKSITREGMMELNKANADQMGGG